MNIDTTAPAAGAAPPPPPEPPPQPQPQPHPTFGFDSAAALPGTPAPQRWPLRFVGSGSEYFRIWIVNLLLTLVTLGLYYPFAKVRRLRYFHGATEVGGHPLSFHADPWKMLRGYLLVGAMVAVYSLAGHFSTTAGVVAFVLVAMLWPALWHSSMRFRMANTGWRGLRFRYTGTSTQAYKVFVLPVLGVAAIIGISLLTAIEPGARPTGQQVLVGLLPSLLFMALFPWFFWLIKRQQHDHYALGDEQTRFEVGVRGIYGVGLRSFGLFLGALVVLVLVVALVGVGGAMLLGMGERGADTGSGGAGGLISNLTGVIAVVSVFLGYLLILTLVGGYFTARLQNLVWNGTRSAHVGFSSKVSAKALGLLWLKNWVLTILTLGLYYPFASIASARMRLQAVEVLSDIAPETLVARGAALDESAAGDAAGDLFGFDVGL